LSLKHTAVDEREIFSCEIPMITLASKRIRLREAMAWVGCTAVLFAALRADTFVTVLILAYPLRLALIARCAGLGIAQGGRRAAILPSWVAFLGDETDERRFARPKTQRSWLRTNVPELVTVISTIAVTSTQCLFD
jgi:hypothetical protein